MLCNQSRIWTRVAVSNSCDDNHYTTGTSKFAVLSFAQCLRNLRSLIKFNCVKNHSSILWYFLRKIFKIFKNVFVNFRKGKSLLKIFKNTFLMLNSLKYDWKKGCAYGVTVIVVESVLCSIFVATVIEVDPKTLFSIATTPRCRGGRYSFPWIAPLYPWYVPYNAEC